MLPTDEDYQAIFQFVQDLPDRSAYGQANDELHKVWTRYRIESDVVTHLLEKHVHDLMHQISHFIDHKVKGLPLPTELDHPEISRMNPAEFMQQSVASLALQVFAFSAEYQQRWVLPDLLAEAKQVENEIDKLIAGE